MNYRVLIFPALLLFVNCGKKPEKTRPVAGNISESVYASGIIKSKNQYQVFSTVPGLIQQILVEEGDVVKAGDPLLIVKNETSRLTAENARLAAEYAAANTQGDRLQELRSAIETARSKMLSDSILLTRQRGLWAQQIGSKVELEQRELAFINSKNNYQAAIYRLNDLQRQLRFAAEQSRKQLAISNTISGDYVVRSQTAGRVYSISKKPGEVVNVQMPVAVIGDAEVFMVELQVDENDIARIRTGQRVLLSMDSYKGQVFEAVVSKIDPYMNERTRTFTVDAEFKNKPAVLYPNLTAEANIILQSKENVLTIPRAFLVDDSLVILENKEKRPVKTGLKDNTEVEIISGLNAGESIIKPEK